MAEKKQKKAKPTPKNTQPYKRRSEAQMAEIVREIYQEGLPKRTACIKYGLNRNTLNLSILKQFTKGIHKIHSLDLSSIMNENALAERMNDILKNEFYPKRIYQNHKEAKKVLSSNIEIYNNKRPHLSLDYLTPTIAHEIIGPINKKWKEYSKKRKDIIFD